MHQAFEILQTNLTSFGIDNWRSTIRHNVSVHEKYRDIEPWTGRETADIVYEDQSSKLTALLIAYGYLPFLHWLNKTPTYYLEVKTTTGPCDTRFFMSKAQVRRVSIFISLISEYRFSPSTRPFINTHESLESNNADPV